jgi:hypothetical protein
MHFRTNAHLLVEFGLALLVALFKTTRFAKDDTAAASMLRPFAALLVRCLHSKYNRIMELSLKALTQLIKTKIVGDAVAPFLDHVTTRVFKLVRAVFVRALFMLASTVKITCARPLPRVPLKSTLRDVPPPSVVACIWSACFFHGLILVRHCRVHFLTEMPFFSPDASCGFEHLGGRAQPSLLQGALGWVFYLKKKSHGLYIQPIVPPYSWSRS